MFITSGRCPGLRTYAPSGHWGRVFITISILLNFLNNNFGLKVRNLPQPKATPWDNLMLFTPPPHHLSAETIQITSQTFLCNFLVELLHFRPAHVVCCPAGPVVVELGLVVQHSFVDVLFLHSKPSCQ